VEVTKDILYFQRKRATLSSYPITSNLPKNL